MPRMFFCLLKYPASRSPIIPADWLCTHVVSQGKRHIGSLAGIVQSCTGDCSSPLSTSCSNPGSLGQGSGGR